MKFQNILRRLTGINSPVFGITWQPTPDEQQTARSVITFLEDRRVLYEPSQVESPHYCVQSVLQIREFLNAQLQQFAEETELCQTLRAMRAACRKFLSHFKDERDLEGAQMEGHYRSWIFISALGELRGIFGLHIAKLAAAHGLDVEDELARILPEEDAAEPASPHHRYRPRPRK